ncbi:MAG TPA: hypothetical protein VEV43_08810 [Actinomycetota bacterium]|nr:hypothetical protein [Actinomycetota bacterium]
MSRCFRAIVGAMCLGSMASFTTIAAFSPPPIVVGALLVIGIVGGAVHGSAHDACKEV